MVNASIVVSKNFFILNTTILLHEKLCNLISVVAVGSQSVNMLGMSEQPKTSIWSELKKKQKPVAKPEPFHKVFTKTALDRGCTRAEIDSLLKEIATKKHD